MIHWHNCSSRKHSYSSPPDIPCSIQYTLVSAQFSLSTCENFCSNKQTHGIGLTIGNWLKEIKKKTELQSQPEAGLDVKEEGELACGWIEEKGDEDNVSIREVHLK